MTEEDLKKYGVELTAKVHWHSLVPVTKYRSKSGISVIIADVEKPLSSVNFYVSSGRRDDEILSRGVERLLFLGSEEYPYRGVVDLLSNRCLVSEVFSYTLDNYTVYSYQSAGTEGALSMLPVYLDHIFHPLLTEHGFVEKIHHVTKEGLDGGELYFNLEMKEGNPNQLIQRVVSDILHLSEFENFVEKLITSTTIDQIRSYHSEHYRPDNLTILLVGSFSLDEVFRTIQPIEDKLISKNKIQSEPKPSQSSVETLAKTHHFNINYPFPLNIDRGTLEITWLGPNLTTLDGVKELTPLTIILEYLIKCRIRQELKDIDEEKIYSDVYKHSTARISITVENIPLDNKNDVMGLIFRELDDIIIRKATIDIFNLHIIIENKLNDFFSAFESNLDDHISSKCITDVIHLQDDDQVILDMEILQNDYTNIKELLHKNEDWWRSLLERYLGKHYIALTATPSVELWDSLHEAKYSKIAARKQELGKEGLEEKSQKLLAASKYHQQQVPPELLESVKAVDFKKLPFDTFQSWSYGDSCPYFNLDGMPFYTQINNLKTCLVYMTLIINTSCLCAEQRKYLPLLLKLFQGCPTKRNGKIVPRQTVFFETSQVFYDLYISLGRGGSYDNSLFTPGNNSQLIIISANCEPDQYSRAVKLLHEMLTHSIFAKETIYQMATELFKELEKVNANIICRNSIRDILYCENSNVHWCSSFRQFSLINDIIAKTDDVAFMSDILTNLEKVRQLLLTPENMWLHMSTDVEKNQLRIDPWTMFGPQGAMKKFTVADNTVMLPSDEVQNKGYIVGIDNVECYLQQNSPGPMHTNHEDLPALTVLVEYLTETKGPLSAIETNLSSKISIRVEPEEGVLRLSLFRMPNMVQVYNQVLKIIKEFLEDPNWDESLLNYAKNQLVFEYARDEGTPYGITITSFTNQLRGLDINHNRNFIRSIGDVTVEDAFKVAKKWLPGLYETKLSSIFIVADSSEIDGIHEGFSELGFELVTIQSLEEYCGRVNK